MYMTVQEPCHSNPVHTLTLYFFKIHFNINPPPPPNLCLGFPNCLQAAPASLSYAEYIILLFVRGSFSSRQMFPIFYSARLDRNFFPCWLSGFSLNALSYCLGTGWKPPSVACLCGPLFVRNPEVSMYVRGNFTSDKDWMLSNSN
jgi:hypothetical protein